MTLFFGFAGCFGSETGKCQCPAEEAGGVAEAEKQIKGELRNYVDLSSSPFLIRSTRRIRKTTSWMLRVCRWLC